jgi:hypothetical protein
VRYRNLFIYTHDHPDGVFIDADGQVREDIKPILEDPDTEKLPSPKRRKLEQQEEKDFLQAKKDWEDFEEGKKEDYDSDDSYVVKDDAYKYFSKDADWDPNEESEAEESEDISEFEPTSDEDQEDPEDDEYESG